MTFVSVKKLFMNSYTEKKYLAMSSRYNVKFVTRKSDKKAHFLCKVVGGSIYSPKNYNTTGCFTSFVLPDYRDANNSNITTGNFTVNNGNI